MTINRADVAEIFCSGLQPCTFGVTPTDLQATAVHTTFSSSYRALLFLSRPNSSFCIYLPPAGVLLSRSAHDFPKTPMLRSYPLSWTAVKCTGAGAANFGERYALSAGGSFTPHVIIVGTGEDVAVRIMSFSQKGPRSVCILSANGTISNVTLRQPDTSGSTFTYEGRFEILQLMGSFTKAEEGRRRTGGLSVSLAGPDGRVVGGVVAGMLRAASPIQVIVGSFLPNSLKQHQRRMSLQQQASAIPALPAPPVPPPVLTAATPISQASPGNGFHAPPPSAAAPPQPHASTEEHGAMNLNAMGFTMVGWPASSQPAARRASPDINVSLTPQE